MTQIVFEILNWYQKNLRALPWRNTIDPYKIWISEIILQQTQVVQGQKYYENIIELFPKITQLAAAEEETVLKLWQGLGYYSRARNLHKAAKVVSEKFSGVFPQKYEDILSLPGIGEYTAAAVASFAFNQKYPVLDGNVYRFIARLYNIHLPVDEARNRKVFIDILNEMMGEHPPAAFNNAMMEMGAMVCRPSAPLCDQCPVAMYCEALKAGTVNTLPVKNKKVKIRTRHLNYFHIDGGKGFYLEKRKGKGIWQNLYQLPLIETEAKADKKELYEKMKSIVNIKGDFTLVHKQSAKHILTHQVLMTDFWYIKTDHKPVFVNTDIVLTTLKNYKIYAIPKLIDNYLLLL